MWWVHNYPHRGNQSLQRLIFFFFASGYAAASGLERRSGPQRQGRCCRGPVSGLGVTGDRRGTPTSPGPGAPRQRDRLGRGTAAPGADWKERLLRETSLRGHGSRPGMIPEQTRGSLFGAGKAGAPSRSALEPQLRAGVLSPLSCRTFAPCSSE